MFGIIPKKNHSMLFSNVTREFECCCSRALNNHRFPRRANDKTDLDIIRSEHRFLWDDDEDAPEESW